MSKKELKGDWGRIVPGVLLGALVTLAFSVVLVTLCAPLVSSGKVGEGGVRPIVIVSSFVSGAAGALAARIKNGGATLIGGVASGALAVLARVVIMLISGRSGAFDALDAQICLSMLCGALISGAVTVKRRRRRR